MPRQRKSFLNAVLRYGMPPENSQNSPWLARDLRGKPEKHFRAYVSLFMRHLCEPGNENAETFTDGVPREGMSRQQVLTRIGTMALIRKKIKEFEDYNGEFSMPLQELNENNVNDAPANKTANGEPAEKKNEETDSVKVKTEKVEESEKTESKESPVEESNGKVESESEKPSVDENELNKESADKAEQDGKDESAESKAVDENDKEANDENQKEEKMEVDEQASGKQPAKEDDKESKETDSDQPKETKSPVKKELSADDEEGKTKENKENDQQNEQNHSKPVEKANKPKFMFNIADGGFTELHAIWQTEEKAAAENVYETWHRRHDYWLLAGIVKHGYARWQDIQADPVFDIINEPFKGDLNKGNFIEIKNKFIIRRFKLLEQALAIEEQLKRAQQLKLTPEQNSPVLSLNTKFNEMECIAEANQHLVKEQAGGNHSKQATVVLKNVLNQLDELLNDMKMDANRLPQTLTRVQTVSQRLLLSERTILTRLAGQAQAQQAQLLQRQLLVQQALQQQQFQAQLLQQIQSQLSQSQLTPEQIQMIQQGLLNSNR